MASSADVDGGGIAVGSAAHTDMASELDPSLLPLETRFPPLPLRQYGGFWLPEFVLPGVAAVHARFQPRPSDFIIASFPKSGTTWLKALAFATANRADHPPSGDGHPLRHRNPHDYVKFLESPLSLPHMLEALPSPRLLGTHLPCSLLPERVTAATSGCRIVYICRDHKDALVSSWFFTNKYMEAAAAGGSADEDAQPSPPPYTIDDAFELFCDGRCVSGPQWRHVLGYWEASQRRPEKVLFLRYEDMLREPVRSVRKLAEFMGCAFTGEEDAAGVAHAIVELCSLDNLRSQKANKNGTTTTMAISNESFFRKGVAGDWSNHLSPEMAAQLDTIVEDALQGSGFTFEPSIGNSIRARE